MFFLVCVVTSRTCHDQRFCRENIDRVSHWGVREMRVDGGAFVGDVLLN